MIEEFPAFSDIFKERLALYAAETEARVPLDFASELLPAEASIGTDRDEVETDESLTSEGDDSLFADEKGFFRNTDRKKPKISFVRQIDQMDCGAAALGMICRHFGRKVSLAKIRQLCEVARRRIKGKDCGGISL